MCACDRDERGNKRKCISQNQLLIQNQIECIAATILTACFRNDFYEGQIEELWPLEQKKTHLNAETIMGGQYPYISLKGNFYSGAFYGVAKLLVKFQLGNLFY